MTDKPNAVTPEHSQSRDGIFLAAVLTALASFSLVAAFGNSTDFTVLHRAAQRAQAHDLPLYRVADAPSVYRYYPVVAMELKPFAGMELQTAARIWAFLCLACLGGCLYLLPRCFPSSKNSGRGLLCLALALIFTSPYIHYHFMYGQIMLPMLFLMLIACRAAQRGHDSAAGAGLALAVSVKIIPAFMGLWFLARKKYTALLWAALFSAILLALPALNWGCAENSVELREWLKLLGTPEGLMSRLVHQNQSLYAMAGRLLALAHYGSLSPVPNDDPLMTSTTLIVFSNALRLALVGWYIWILTRMFKMAPTLNEKNNADGSGVEYSFSAFSVGLILMVLLPPLGWVHYFVVLLPANFILARRWIENGDKLAGVIACAAFLLGGVISQGALGFQTMALANQLGAKTISALALAWAVSGKR